MGYLFILLTIVLTAYGQLAIKWQVGLAGPLPDSPEQKFGYFLRLLLNPWVISAIAAAFASSETTRGLSAATVISASCMRRARRAIFSSPSRL